MAKRAKRDVDNPEFFRFAWRIVDAAGRRVRTGDIEALPALLDLGEAVQLAGLQAVIALRLDHGYSWQDIGDRMGFSRQAAQKRWGDVVRREEARRKAHTS